MASERHGLGEERLRAEFAAGNAPAAGGRNCPSPERLWLSAGIDGGAASEPEIIDHLAACGECGALWRLGRELQMGSRAGGIRVRRRVIGAAFAAAAALVVTGALIGALFTTAGPSVTRREARAEFRGAPSAWLQPAPGSETLDRGRCVLRWAEGPPGTHYDVRVLDTELRPVARGFHLGEPRFEISPRQLQGLESGAIILWQVTAQLPDGRRMQSSTFRSLLR